MKVRFNNEIDEAIRVFAILPIVAIVTGPRGGRKIYSLLIQWLWFAVNVDF